MKSQFLPNICINSLCILPAYLHSRTNWTIIQTSKCLLLMNITLTIFLTPFPTLYGANSDPKSGLPYQELMINFDRKKSPAMIRKIDRPTLANLDFAAYNNNPVRFDPEKQKPKPPQGKIEISSMTFNQALLSPVNSLAETPLTDDEKNQPVAWTPLQNLFWSELKIDDFKRVGSKIISYKWNDPDIFKPYQEIAACYIHKTNSQPELWVKIEFSSWISFLSGLTDEDGDGFLEIYGKLNTEAISKENHDKAFSWIKSNYQNKILNREQVIDWITNLASYWYPTLNTDVVDMSNVKQWPNRETERKIRRKIKKPLNQPTAVVRGNPHGKPIYNIYLVSGMAEKTESQEPTQISETISEQSKELDRRISTNFTQNEQRFQQEVSAYNGSYANWFEQLGKVVKVQKNMLATLPAKQMGFQGLDKWLFFRKSFEYILAGDLDKQKKETNPLPALLDLKAFCDERKINLLFIAVPTKTEVYFDKTGLLNPKQIPKIVNPYGRKFLADVQKAGIEVIDLLPAFLAGKKNDASSKEYVYQLQDTHWTNRGIQIAARLIAGRIKNYSWYSELNAKKKEYSVHDTSFNRLGDIVERLPEKEQLAFHPAALEAQQVRFANGKRYRGNRNDPILLIGDSFTGVYELVGCKSAGIGSHIAVQTGLGVDIINSWGGGPLVRNKMTRIRKDNFNQKRVIIYLMIARDLYNYSQGWEPLKVE